MVACYPTVLCITLNFDSDALFGMKRVFFRSSASFGGVICVMHADRFLERTLRGLRNEFCKNVADFFFASDYFIAIFMQIFV